jgi:hypothetical protein
MTVYAWHHRGLPTGPRNPAWSGGLDNYVPEPNTGCWLWLGRVTANGYARAWDPMRRTARYAHRILFERERGPIPVGLDLDHLCRIRSCVNPAHLEPVTRQKNLRRGHGTREENRWKP